MLGKLRLLHINCKVRQDDNRANINLNIVHTKRATFQICAPEASGLKTRRLP